MDYQTFLDNLISVKKKEINIRFNQIDKRNYKQSIIYLIYAKSKNVSIPPNKFYVGVTSNLLSVRLKQHIRESFMYNKNKTTKKIEWIKTVLMMDGELEIIELVRVPHINKRIRYVIESEFIEYFTRNGLFLTNHY